MSPSQLALIQEAIHLEEAFAANNYHGKTTNQPITVIQKHKPIIIAAPHAVAHPRDGGIKKAEAFTGAISTQLAHATGCHAIILSRSNHEDPNHDPSGPFKDTLSQMAQKTQFHALINLHGMAETRPWDVAFGSNFGKSLGSNPTILTKTINSLQSYGIKNHLIDDKEIFAASNENNISVYAWEKLGIPSFQIEINYSHRKPWHSPASYLSLYNGLISAINSYVN